jgi:two-component system, OmpR family, phosphate regulon sensor histidine kinase PhoR
MSSVMHPASTDASVATGAVIVVDDDDALRETAVDILGANGISAEGAGSAAQAWEMHAEHAPAVALIDQRLPDSSGVELGAAMKERDPDLTVLLVTGYASLENAIAAVWQLDGYLTKPVPPAELVRVVRSGLEHARLRRENRALVEELRDANLRLERSVAERTAELSGLVSLAEALAGSSDLDEVVQACLASASEVTDALYAGLYLRDGEGLVLRAHTPGSNIPERLDDVPARLDARGHDGAGASAARFGDAVALTAGGQEVGALVFGGAARRQRMFLAALAASTAVAIQNAQRLERERDTVAQLSEVSRMKTTFLATVSHELRTPLAAVLGLAELLARPAAGGAALERRTEMAVQVLDQAQHLGTMIDDLLDATRVEFGGLRVSREPVDVDRVAERVRHTWHARGHALETTVEAGLPRVIGDEARLVQVLNNLAGNAFKHSPAGVPVELLVSRDGDRVAIVVADSGSGIEPDFLERIFQPFTQASNAGTRTEGLGLGLYIVHGLVGSMGGTIEASSLLGVGSRFTVRLGLAPD